RAVALSRAVWTASAALAVLTRLLARPRR
ncbi:MAG: hypothetical protein JWQ53_282, partial [Klenkia sp.]|nr:hypothetical protein [Klenkia sp.]